MATTTSHNKKSSAVKRILSEAREFSANDVEFTASPLEDNIFEWHFTLRGPSSSEFEEGIYHGRILLPAEYPFRPPDVMLLTPNGRWELNKKICLTFTGFHEEMWQPAWGIRTALIGVQAFMGARAEAAVGVGSLNYPEEEREKLARKSRDWTCAICQVKNSSILRDADSRKEETLPEGLTISTQPESNEPKDLSAAESSEPRESVPPRIQQTSPNDDDKQEHSFGPSGPPDALLASIVDGQTRLSAQAASVASSCVTSGVNTPVGAGNNQSGPVPSTSDKGKRSELMPTGSSSSSASASTSSSTYLLRTTSDTRQQARAEEAARPVNDTSDPERRLAVLDRAIATVLFLLLALLLRRLLNSVS